MKEITILSGKGGTGKTSIAAALLSIVKNAIFCDNDVDAPDLHLILKPRILEEHVYEGAWLANIDSELCSNCGVCKENCRFDAISFVNNNFIINPYKCEGCKLCVRICHERAISAVRSRNNYWFVSDTRFGKFVHAKMGPGEENSGKLVTEIRRRAYEIAEENNHEFILNDGPPGIGCTAISSITGTQNVLLVIEPSISGFHDAKRLIELVNTFSIPMYAIINKSDLNDELTNEIDTFLEAKSIFMLAKIPFEEDFVHAMVEGKSIVEYNPDSKISKMLIEVWKTISQN